MAKLCDSKMVEDKMRKGIDVAKTVEFNSNSYVYLNTIFRRFKSELRKNDKFLEFLECSQISSLFENFLKETGNYNKTQNLDICGIEGGDILFIKCPSIFASYHFIVVAVNLEKTQVSIIQSFGNFKKFHKIDMKFEEFNRQLKLLQSFNPESKSFDDAYPEMIGVEALLYGVDDKKYIEHLERHRNSLENSQSNNEDNEVSESEENSFVERAEALDIPPEIYENLEYQYGINNIRLEIYAYRVKDASKTDLCKKSANVGKKKSKSKNIACRKSNLKRKVRRRSTTGKKSKLNRKKKSVRKSK